MAGAFAHPVEVVPVTAETSKDLTQDGDVAQLAVGADQAGLTDAPLHEDAPHVRAVVLVGGDVVVARAVLPACLDEGVGALDVGLEERARVGDGVVVVGLCGVVDHGVGPRDQAVDQVGVADVAHDELDALRGQPRDVLGVAGVGQLVEDGDVRARVLARGVVDEVGADEAAAAGDDDALRLEDAAHSLLPSLSQTPDVPIASVRCKGPHGGKHAHPPDAAKRSPAETTRVTHRTPEPSAGTMADDTESPCPIRSS